MSESIVDRFARRLGYTDAEREAFLKGGHRVRQVERLAEAARLYTIEARVVAARHCNSGYREGDRFVLDADGNLIPRHCPRKLCVYLVSQLIIPVALINERLSEGLNPNDFHFMHRVRCLDVGVECSGYGETMVEVRVVPREKVKLQ